MNTTTTPPFLAEIERLMDEKGIPSIPGLEKLHERFIEQEPERFRKHVAAEAGALSFQFMVPLVEAMEATEEEQSRLFLVWFEDVTQPRPAA